MSAVLDAIKQWWMASDQDFDTLYQESIRREDEGDLEGAIRCLRQALQKAHESSHVTSTLEQHLRLPLLLQQAGQFEEARGTFDQFLTRGYPGQLQLPSVKWVERGIVYDKMHLAFKREGCPKEALIYGVLSFIADSYGHYADMARLNYEEDMVRIQSRSTHEAVAENLLSDAEVNLPQEELTDILGRAVGQFDDEKIDQIIRDVEERLRDRLLDDLASRG